MDALPTATFLCNGASRPTKVRKADTMVLDYRGKNPNVKLRLPDFVRDVLHLPDRVLDLLEIAAYTFAADRSVSRGDCDAVEYHAWSRSLRLCIKVRDIGFWKRAIVQEKLSKALQWMSGDQQFDFTFQPGHSTPATSLFDHEGINLHPGTETEILLFSGGLKCSPKTGRAIKVDSSA